MKSKFIWLVALFAAFMLAACEPLDDEEGDSGPATEETEEEPEEIGNGAVGSIVGVPDVDSFSLSTNAVVENAGELDGVTSTFIVHVGDRHNHPVVDGTRVSFWTEFGQIEESCETSGGSCEVTWTSVHYCPILGGNCRPLDGKSTVIAFTLGEDSYLEAGERNGIYNVDSDSDLLLADETIISTPELYYDRNSDGYTDSSYTDAGTGLVVDSDAFEDYNNDGVYNDSSNKYRGTKCSAQAINEEHCQQEQIHVWDQTQICLHEGPLQINLPVGGPWVVGTTYQIEVTDANGNYPPAETSLAVSELVAGTPPTIEGTVSNDPVENVGRCDSVPHIFEYTLDSSTGAGTLELTVTGGGDETIARVSHN